MIFQSRIGDERRDRAEARGPAQLCFNDGCLVEGGLADGDLRFCAAIGYGGKKTAKAGSPQAHLLPMGPDQ